jgi:glycosyltransferase involved in cell wall biosynthesis
MLIGIDASPAVKAQPTGTERYTAEIIKSLTAIDRANRYRLYAPYPPPKELRDLGKNTEWRILPFGPGWTSIRLSVEMLIHPPDLFFVPSNRLPLIHPRRSVIMLHDLAYRDVPETFTRLGRFYLWSSFLWAKWFAAHILAPSRFTETALHHVWGIKPARTSTIFHGYNAPKLSKRGRKPGPRMVPEPYFYYVGRIEDKKNISNMLRAFAIFKKSHGTPNKFVLSGKPGRGHDDIMSTYRALGAAKKDVLFTGYVSEEVRDAYMKHADALMFVSRHEGFGIPVLDAFALGTPVITSNSSSLPEIAGDAALLASPDDAEQIADAMHRITTDGRLKRALIRKGFARARSFPWERAAAETLAVFRKVGSR